MDTSYLPIARLDDLAEDTPAHAEADGIDLVLVRRAGEVHVFEGRCPHRGALLADGRVEGPNLICGVHGWDYRLDTGVSAYNPAERIYKFTSHVDGRRGAASTRPSWSTYRSMRPERPVTSTYDRLFDDPHQDTAEEPFVSEIHALARNGLSGAHGDGRRDGRAPRRSCPRWDDLQVLTAQLHRFPLLDDEPVDTTVTIGPAAARPLRLQHPGLRVRHELRRDLRRGQDRARPRRGGRGHRDLLGRGRDAARGAGRVLPLPLRAGVGPVRLGRGAASTGCRRCTSSSARARRPAPAGTCPAARSSGGSPRCAGLPEGTAAVSPARFTDWTTLLDARALVDRVRERSGGIPVGVKMSAQHIEADLDAALDLGVDYVILDGRGGGTGAAPTIFRDTISVPTMAALARARRHLDLAGARDVTLVATGGFRRAQDMVKALALGADAIAVSNVALQAIGCVGMRACHTDNCPMGIATQKPHLRARLPVQRAAEQLDPLPGRDHRADGGAGQGVRARLAVALHAARPDQLETRRRRAGRRRLRGVCRCTS